MKKKLQDFFYKKNRQQQIKGFYYSAFHRSISKAADAMCLNQSTVSLQIQSLERDLGFKLLNRESKPLSLTKNGEDFYKTVCPLMHDFEVIVEKFLNNKEEDRRKKLDIAVHHVAISYLMPSIIANFKKNNPEVEIIIRNISPSEAVQSLKEGKIDLAFYPNIPNQAEFKKIEVASYDPVLIMNKKHPLAKKISPIFQI